MRQALKTGLSGMLRSERKVREAGKMMQRKKGSKSNCPKCGRVQEAKARQKAAWSQGHWPVENLDFTQQAVKLPESS